MALVLLLTSLSRLADGIPCPNTSCPDVTALSVLLPETPDIITEWEPFLVGVLNPSPPKSDNVAAFNVPSGVNGDGRLLFLKWSLIAFPPY